MNTATQRKINPNKLLLSKWTAVQPHDKEKHFLVTRVIKNDQAMVIACILESVMHRNEYELDWRLLKDTSKWLSGWC